MKSRAKLDLDFQTSKKLVKPQMRTGQKLDLDKLQIKFRSSLDEVQMNSRSSKILGKVQKGDILMEYPNALDNVNIITRIFTLSNAFDRLWHAKCVA